MRIEFYGYDYNELGIVRRNPIVKLDMGFNCYEMGLEMCDYCTHNPYGKFRYPYDCSHICNVLDVFRKGRVLAMTIENFNVAKLILRDIEKIKEFINGSSGTDISLHCPGNTLCCDRVLKKVVIEALEKQLHEFEKEFEEL